MARKVRDFRTQEELSEYVNSVAWSESVDDEDFSSDDSELDPDFEFEAAFRNEGRLEDEEGCEVIDAAGDVADEEIGNNVAISPHIGINVEPNAAVAADPIVGDRSPRLEDATMFEHIIIDKDSNIFKKPLWRKRYLQLSENLVQFRGADTLTQEIQELKSPLQFFSFLFSDAVISNIVEQSNLYAIQKDIGKPLNTTPDEIKRFMGRNYYMSVYKYPSVRSYWGEYGFNPIIESMSRNRHDKIRQFLHFNNNEMMSRRQHVLIPQNDSSYDRLYKIRPVITALNNNFKKVPKRARLCVDEQICAIKIRHYLKQYMPDKPHPWGDKLFLLRDDSGFCYSFEIYSGDDDHREGNEPNLEMRVGKVRPSNLEAEIAVKRQRPMSASLPSRDIRLDNVGHLPEFVKESKPRCKYPKCTSRTKVRCQKCDIHLCFSAEKNSFAKFYQD